MRVDDVFWMNFFILQAQEPFWLEYWVMDQSNKIELVED